VGRDQVRGFLNKLVMHKFMGPDGMHSCLLRKMADVLVWPLLIFERSPRTISKGIWSTGYLFIAPSSGGQRR